MNYEQILQAAKDEVAKGYGYSDWATLEADRDRIWEIELLHKAAILAMQRVAEAHQDLLIRLQDYMNDKADVVDVEGSITPVANIEMNFSTEIESLIKIGEFKTLKDAIEKAESLT